MSEPTEYKPLVHIENAEIHALYGGEEWALILRGDVVDHPRHAEGTNVTTSRIVTQDLAAGIFETENTVYQLVR